jgi:hypothetical protein
VEFGTVIREAQATYGLTNEMLGRMINYSPEMVSKIKSGSRRVPVDAIPKLAELSPRIGLELYASMPNSTLTCGWLREATGGDKGDGRKPCDLEPGKQKKQSKVF